MNINTTELQASVINKAVEQIVEHFTDPDHEISNLIHEKAQELILERVNQSIDDRIKKFIEGGFESVVFPHTNNFGEKKGPDRTVREFIADIADKVFNEYLDNNDKPTTESWYTKDPNNRRINKLLRKEIHDKVTADVTAAAKAVVSQINTKIAEFVNQSLKDAVSKLEGTQ